MPFLKDALDANLAAEALRGTLGPLRVEKAELARHRAGRRALISYSITDSERFGMVEILGKVRAKGLDERSHAVQTELHERGFPAPQTLGLVPEFSMWLQKKIPGTEATKLLGGEDGARVAEGCAKLIKSLHASGVKPRRKPHTLADEMTILEERLPLVAERRPEFSGHTERLLEASRKLVQKAGETDCKTGIHRDFYQDQVLVSESGLFLLDLDLYCEGDPALDAGNFLAHVAEQSLRERGDADAMRKVEDAFLSEFVGGDGELAERVSIYRTLTLVRHVQISDRIPNRREFTPELISVCESLLEI